MTPASCGSYRPPSLAGAIGFAEKFDEKARYLIEYFDGDWYVLNE